MSDLEKDLLREEYTLRINKVQDYIEEHLAEELSLAKLSEVAHFSPYHFHRIFSSLTGETLFEYIQRARLEKAASSLIANPNETVTQMALNCGFSNQASFAKAFKKRWKISATGFREKYMTYQKRTGKAKSKIGKVSSELRCYNNPVIKKQCDVKEKFEDIAFSVEVKDIQEMHTVYIRHTGPYQQDADLFERLFNKLDKWVKSTVPQHTQDIKTLILCHDSPNITDENKLRISMCLTVPKGINGEGEIGNLTIAGGKYAVGHFELAYDEYGSAWGVMYSKWLPESGYQPDDRLAFELSSKNETNTNKSAILQSKQVVDIYIPIRRL